MLTIEWPIPEFWSRDTCTLLKAFSGSFPSPHPACFLDGINHSTKHLYMIRVNYRSLRPLNEYTLTLSLRKDYQLWGNIFLGVYGRIPRSLRVLSRRAYIQWYLQISLLSQSLEQGFQCMVSLGSPGKRTWQPYACVFLISPLTHSNLSLCLALLHALGIEQTPQILSLCRLIFPKHVIPFQNPSPRCLQCVMLFLSFVCFFYDEVKRNGGLCLTLQLERFMLLPCIVSIDLKGICIVILELSLMTQSQERKFPMLSFLGSWE